MRLAPGAAQAARAGAASAAHSQNAPKRPRAAPPRPRRTPLARSVPDRASSQQLQKRQEPAIDARKLTELFAQQPMDDEGG
jgi:hypothetical protein